MSCSWAVSRLSQVTPFVPLFDLIGVLQDSDMWPQEAFNRRWTIAFPFPGDNSLLTNSRIKGVLRKISLALLAGLVVVTADFPCRATEDRVLTVSVAYRDLRPLWGVTLQLAGAVNQEGVTDANGLASFPELPATG